MISQDRKKPFKGVFSTTKKTVIGTGTTKKRVRQTVHYFVEQKENGSICMQALNQNMVPVGDTIPVSQDDLLANYVPEPDVFLNKVVPQLKKVEEHVRRGERMREDGALYTAEFEFKCALALAEDHLRAIFGLGLIYLERGDISGADAVFKKIITLDAAFGPDNKHLFNDFGIRLRKARMLEQAVEYYRRAIELCDDDEHLYYNIGRAYLERGEYENAMTNGRKALDMRPDFKACSDLVRIAQDSAARNTMRL
jgi:tetratricopeptide (TPR) repeat protein